MKKTILYTFLTLTLVGAGMLCSCRDNDDPVTPTPSPAPSDSTVVKKDSVKATLTQCERPSWANQSETYFSAMYMYILDNSLPEGLAIGENDIIAAFIGDECRCATQPYKDADGTLRYDICIAGEEADADNVQVVIRYYSAAKGGYYTTDSLTYQDQVILGSATAGYELTWK